MKDNDQIKHNRKILTDNLRVQLTRELYKKSFYDFFIQACSVLEPHTDWQFNFHIKYLCDLMQSELYRIKAGKPRTKDLIVNVPPRTSKSTLFTVVFPVWCWIVFPQCRLFSISYSDSLAVEHSTQSIRLMNTEWFKGLFPEIKITDTQYSKSHYTNTEGGARKASGIYGSLLGFSGDIVLLDDPNTGEENSIVALENVSNIYKSVVYSRLNNPSTGIRIIIQQRLHERDLTGYLLKNNGDQYKHICLPAELTDDVRPVELAQYYKPSAEDLELLESFPDLEFPKFLWADRFSQQVLSNERSMKGSYGYTTQFLLRANAVDGGILKPSWLNTVDSLPEGIKWNIFIDSAYTKNTKRDPSAIMIAGVYNNILYIREVYQVWLEFPELIRKINSIAKDYPTSMIYVEPKASGLSIVQELKRNTMLNVVEIPLTKGDKQGRVNAIAPKLEAGRVKLYKADWNSNFLSEVGAFPTGLHDDQIDTLVMAINKLLINSNKLSYRMY